MFSILLVLCMLVGLAACGSSTDPGKQQEEETKTPTTEEQTDSKEEKPEEAEEKEEVFDLGGATIVQGAWFNLRPEPGTSEAADNTLARIAELEEKYNFKMEFLELPVEQYHENFTSSILAGDPIVDVGVIEDRQFFPGYVAKGFLYPLSDLGVFDFEDPKWNKAFIDFTTYKGKVYGMATGKTDPRSGIFWNKTIFEREGMPNLYELQNSRQWTWDKMLEIAQKLTKDIDGDGIIDRYGLGGMWIDAAFVFSNNAETIKVVDGKPVFGLTDPNAIEALQFYQDLIHVHKVFEVPPAGAEWGYEMSSFQSGRTAMFHGQQWMAWGFQSNMEDDYGFVVFPMGPKAENYVSPLNAINFKVMPINVKHPRETAIIFDELTEPFPGDSPDDWKNAFIDSFRDMESLDTIDMMHRENMFKNNLFDCFPSLVELSWGYMGAINRGEKTAKVAIEEIAQQAQAILDDTMAALEAE